jgi:hypothetical protein
LIQLSSKGRLIYAMALGMILAALLPVTAVAKMPYFTVDITPAEPRPGESIVITMRTWEDSAHTIPAAFDVEFSDLLVIRSASHGSPDVPVSLNMRQPGWFESTVSLPAGDWAVVAFPNRSGWATPEVPVGYPDSIAVTVREPSADGLPLLISAAVTLAVLAVIIGLRLRLSTRPFHRLWPATP